MCKALTFCVYVLLRTDFFHLVTKVEFFFQTVLELDLRDLSLMEEPTTKRCIRFGL